jgi:hypothetical protein
MPTPLFILAPGRSYTSVISAMLGQHPQLHGILEMNLNVADGMHEWWTRFKSGRGPHSRGLLRTVAQIAFGEQNEATVELARRWLRERLHWPTAVLHRTLIENLAPQRVVEKSPVGVNDDRELYRLLETFPDAQFLHLVRHPKGTCHSFVSTDWARQLLIMAFPQNCDFSTDPPSIDTQMLWYDSHLRILRFTEQLAPAQTMRIRGEDLLADPPPHLRAIAAWLGARDDDAAIEEMLHPERSPYARVGPANAIGGADMGFLQSPALRPFKQKNESLEGPLPWRPDGGGFVPELKELARHFGYH